LAIAKGIARTANSSAAALNLISIGSISPNVSVALSPYRFTTRTAWGGAL